jgi:hypothetical protein
LLNDQSVLVRSLATETLGLYCDEPDKDIPRLLKLAQSDPEVVVRIQGIKAIWRIQTRFGPISADRRSLLEEISKQDKSEVVRACVDRFLAGKNP